MSAMDIAIALPLTNDMKASDQVFAFPVLDLTVTWQSKLRNSKSRNSI